ncbi:PREDICTED: uncharacterized protein LOC108971993 [Bactrocera latifrons]|uniref:uncharacterized protein LOC108971993 n=1 Tax=Bactrocera latifrons TaxID=174628 RepID=UPI0008DCC9DB|nr:PREDICTED: uncharacterized protein LOC108971993 [Bactrocera latifrons]XP_018793937.1 PREDICTED: uncharacterized protein LOC108971993 [Bactrocera latifrons]XP_018793939.1 PREDICTED: uncharacterized protein LOC108971993 [Bactrocera latifrons]
MVNELNKPPSPENLALGERLIDSQRQLQEMQEEHRQLLQEMQVLRQRAAALSHLNEEQFSRVGEQRGGTAPIPDAHENNTDAQQNDSTEFAAAEVEEQEAATIASPNDGVEQSENLNTDSSQKTLSSSQTNASENEEDNDDPETAEYLQKKLAEIAALKARFKHVQNIMNTTEKIEEHIASRGILNNTATAALESTLTKLLIADSKDEVQSPCVTSTTTIQSTTKLNKSDTNIQPSSKLNESDTEVKKYENTANDEEQTHNSYVPSQVTNEELLSAMMNMFSDFTADLRSQADDLRAERDRLRALKEDLLRRKRQS